MQTVPRALPERAGSIGPLRPDSARTVAATTAIQVMTALAAMGVTASVPVLAISAFVLGLGCGPITPAWRPQRA
jgi:hypothetical protein